MSEMGDLSICVRCKGLTIPRPSKLCLKCMAFDEIDSGKPFREKSQRGPEMPYINETSSQTISMASMADRGPAYAARVTYSRRVDRELD